MQQNSGGPHPVVWRHVHEYDKGSYSPFQTCGTCVDKQRSQNKRGDLRGPTGSTVHFSKLQPRVCTEIRYCSHDSDVLVDLNTRVNATCVGSSR